MILNVPDIHDHEQLAANRERLIVELRARLNVFEHRYALRSGAVRAALDEGVVRETAEVATWLIEWDMYSVLLDERQARAE